MCHEPARTRAQSPEDRARPTNASIALFHETQFQYGSEGGTGCDDDSENSLTRAMSIFQGPLASHSSPSWRDDPSRCLQQRSNVVIETRNPRSPPFAGWLRPGARGFPVPERFPGFLEASGEFTVYYDHVHTRGSGRAGLSRYEEGFRDDRHAGNAERSCCWCEVRHDNITGHW
ncbi:hypothetical protein KM043_007451 [Ampulex compressa]|nr:hypothetical protein KM043_007451 [Ampulex compressa]